MSYPGSADLDQKVRQRILTAFGESVRLYREGHAEECRTILRSILEVDPRFTPAQRLEDALGKGAQVDLGKLLGELAANAPVRADETLARAREAISRRDFQDALLLAQSILRELPGHAEARAVMLEAQSRVRAASEVESNLARAEEALSAGMLAEATGFVKLALAADPTHPKLEALSARLQGAGLNAAPEVEPVFEFEAFQQAEEPEPSVPGQGPPAPPALPPIPPAPLAASAAPAGQPWVAATTPPPPPVAAIPVPVPPPREPAVAPPQPPPPLFSFDEAAHDVDFTTPPVAEHAPGGETPPPVGDAAGRIAALLDQGQQAFDRGDFQGAIDTWSRIYLLDAQNAEGELRIEQARRHLEEHGRLAEHRFYEAREAFDQGRRDDARALCLEVLKIEPQHLEAHDLLTRLETPAAPPPPPAESADDVDLFKDDFVPARVSSSGELTLGGSIAGPAPIAPPMVRPSPRPASLGRRLPVSIPLVAAIGGMVLVLVFVGLLLRGTVFSGGAQAVADAIAEADRLAGAGKLQEAITLLQNTEAEGEAANQLNQKALDLARQLRTRNKPAPPAAAAEARSAIAQGKRVKAYQLVREGLAKVPGDPELTQVETDLGNYSPALGALAEAAAAGKWESVKTLAAQVLDRHPTDADADRLWRAATFNAAVVALRSYQVASAHRLLLELAAKGDDPEVKRLVELSASYLARPVDPRYQIFVSSIELRPIA
jgi:tetratricopeptide (TPR) repeat protein